MKKILLLLVLLLIVLYFVPIGLDGDTVPPTKEVIFFGDPLDNDTDNDGLNDREEIEVYHTVASKADSDSDGLTDYEEVKQYNTDPMDSDTDNDGYDDGYEVSGWSDLDPLHKDILLEIDREYGVRVPEVPTEPFEQAPIPNPDGTNGITLHVYYDDEIPARDSKQLESYLNNAYQTEFDYKNQGFYHILVVDNIRNDAAGRTNAEDNGILVEQSRITDYVIMHELGHQLGLYPDDYVGIDSREKTAEQYPSVMNYNHNTDRLRFSNGTGFDDWNHIEESLVETTPSTN